MVLCWRISLQTRSSGVNCHASVDLAAGEVVGHGILDVVAVSNPVVGDHVANVE